MPMTRVEELGRGGTGSGCEVTVEGRADVATCSDGEDEC